MEIEGWIIKLGAIVIILLWGALLAVVGFSGKTIGKKIDAAGDTAAEAVKIASKAVTEIAKIVARMDVHEAHMSNSNDQIKAMIGKFDKIEAHETRISLIESKQEDSQITAKEFEKRVRNLEYANAAHTNR